MKVATVFGYHGKYNLGDDIFLEETCCWLESRLGVNKAFVSARPDRLPASLMGVELHCIDKPRYYISRLRWLRVFRAALYSDILVFSAGSIFRIQPFFMVSVLLWLLKAIKGKSYKIVALGVSVGPVTSTRNKYLLSKVLNNIDYMLVRDERSFKILKCLSLSIPCQLSYDLALLRARNGSVMPASPQEPILAISLNLPICYGTDSRCLEECEKLAIIIQFLKLWMSENLECRVRLITVCTDDRDGDVDIHSYIAKQLGLGNSRVEIINHSFDIERTVVALQTCTAVIASRMHAGVISMLGGVPVYQISYAQKITDFYCHMGLSEEYLYCVPEVSLGSLNRFLTKAMAGQLDEWAIVQRDVLSLTKGKLVQHLDWVAASVTK